MQADLEAVVKAPEGCTTDEQDSAEITKLRTHADRQLQQLRASVEVVAQVRHWIGKIATHESSNPPLFVAANWSDTMGKAAVRVPFAKAQAITQSQPRRL